MEKRELICIGCPLSCALTVTLDQENIQVEGNTCKRGEDYAKKEVTAPKRTVTSTVRVKGGTLSRVSVKTKEDIPKEKIFACMKEIKGVTVEAPVAIGAVVIEDCAGTGVPVIATQTVMQEKEKV